MTGTADTAVSTIAIPAPKRRAPHRWARFILAALVLLAAAVALTVWALTTSSSSNRIQPGTVPVVPAAPVNGYVSFCQNNSDLCVAPAAPAAPDNAYRQFCQNNSDLCAVAARD